MPTAMILPGLYRRAALVMNPEDSRYYIHGVRVEPHEGGGTLLVATNGAVLVALRDPAGWCDAAMTVRLDRPTARLAATRAHATRSRIIVDGDRAGIIEPPMDDFSEDPEYAAVNCLEQLIDFGPRLAALQFRGAHVDGDFVDWRRVVPPRGSAIGGVPLLDARLVGLLGQVFGDREGHVALGLQPSGGGTAAVVVPDYGRQPPLVDGYGLIIPMVAHRTDPIAEWFVA
jgi:hypothetical protein